MRRGGLSRREELYPEAGSLVLDKMIIGRTEKNFTETRQRKARSCWPYGHSLPLREAYLCGQVGRKDSNLHPGLTDPGSTFASFATPYQWDAKDSNPHLIA